jgi:hypothetical protein
MRKNAFSNRFLQPSHTESLLEVVFQDSEPKYRIQAIDSMTDSIYTQLPVARFALPGRVIRPMRRFRGDLRDSKRPFKKWFTSWGELFDLMI